MRILITGVAGFIGSHLAERCLADGHDVWGVDNFETGQKANLANVLENDKFLSLALGIETRRFTTFMLGIKPDVVIHTAASYKDPYDYPLHLLTNAVATARMVVATRLNLDCRFIYFQTSLCYGRPKLKGDTPFQVYHPLNPESSYAISKTAGESYIIHNSPNFVSFRLANVYGPRNLSGPIPTFYRNLVNGKECVIRETWRDFVFIDDLVDIVMAAISGVGHGVFHVSTGETVSIPGLYNLIRSCVGDLSSPPSRVLPPAEDDIETLCIEPNALYAMPSTPLSVGIRKTIKWYDANPPKDTYTHLNNREPGSNDDS